MELETSVKFIRLDSGEDLISQITEVRSDDDTHNYYILTNPMKLLYTTGGGTKPGMFSINLMQWVFHRICEDQDFTIYPDSVLTIGNPSKEMISYYWECIDNFEDKKEDNKRNTQYGEEAMDDTEALEMLQDLIEGIKRPVKGTLH